MKLTVRKNVEAEIDCDVILLELPVRYDDEDIPYDFPFREDDVLTLEVLLSSGKIIGWPKEWGADKVSMKVTDEGTYTLFSQGVPIKSIVNNYVPHGVVPGDYGDYVRLQIDANGVITNWPQHPDVSEFFSDENE